MAEKTMDLVKNDLKELVGKIIDEEDYETETADKAINRLTALKDSKMSAAAPKIGESSSGLIVPEQFRCPISGELMKDPVVLETGETYDRPFIEKWFHKGHSTCPRTKAILSNTDLTPNRLLRGMISQWCAENGLMELPELVEEEVLTNATECHLNELLHKLSSSSLSDQKDAAKELRRLTKTNQKFRGSLFTELQDSLQRLLRPLSLDNINLHPDLQEDLVTTVLNISIHEDNKKHVAEDPCVLPVLILSLEYGNIETKANAAAALFTLSFLDSNKIIIGNAGALKPLIALLDDAHPVAIKDAASAIFSLCIVLENKGKAVCSGAVGSVLRNIMEGVLVDELVSVLALFSTDMKAIDEMCKLDTIPCMLRIIRETHAECVKENCVSILYAMCTTYRSKLREIQADEKVNGTISRLARSGNSRARRKAADILEKLQRVAAITRTA